MNNLVIGSGSIGKRHIKNLLSLGESVSTFDVSAGSLRTVQEKFGIPVFDLLEEGLHKVEVGGTAFICTPANTHIKYAQICADHHLDVFIEKPTSDRLEGIDKLIDTLDNNHLISMVGCNMRFDQGISKVKQLLEADTVGRVYSIRVEFGYDLKRWRPGMDYRDNFAVKKDQGGGIILDCIHELDYLSWLIGNPPQKSFSLAKIVGDLETETEDMCVAISEFPNGVLGEIHVDYLQASYTRRCRVIGARGIIEWDLSKPLKFYLQETNEWTVCSEQAEFDINEMYLKEIQYFLDCKRQRKQPFNTVANSTEVLKWAFSMRDKFYKEQRES